MSFYNIKISRRIWRAIQLFRGKYWKIHNFFSTNNISDAKIKNKQLVNKYDISGFTNNTGLNEKIKTLATKTKLKADQVKIEKF